LAWLAVAYFLAAPAVRAEVHGGIEIGGKGVKATVLDVTGGADGYDIKSLLAKTQNTAIVKGLADTGRFDAGAVAETAAAVAQFAELMRTDYKVPTERLYVVGSSGLFSAIESKPEAIKVNQELLADAVERASHLKMSFIDVDREVELSITGTVPTKYLDTALLLDVGSGNTKGGYRAGAGQCVSMGIPYGSITYSDLVRKRAGNGAYEVTAVALRQEILEPALRKALEGKEGQLKRDRIYLSGGACWALATLIHPGDRGAYVALTADDVDAYCKQLLDAPGVFPSLDLSTISDPVVRAAAEKEIAQVKNVYKVPQLLGGAEILKALATTYDFGSKKVFFARNAQSAWIIAYVVEKSK
jgi:exopolyphosphatase/pppGpp-phosphohydrolase